MNRTRVVIPEVRVAATEEVRMLQWPKEVNEEEKNLVLSCLISTIGAGFPDYLACIEMTYNIFQLAIPGLAGQLSGIKGVKVVMVSPAKEELFNWLRIEETAVGPGAHSYPYTARSPTPGSYGITAPRAVFSAVASMLFATGRQASEQSQAAALDKRPDALIRKFTIPEEEQALLPGRESGPSRRALEEMYNAYSTYTEFRADIARYLLGVQRSVAHPPLYLDILLTNFSLMRGAGMTHVEAIMKLAKMKPWVLKVPQLAPYWAKFMEDLELFQVVDADIRPYHRLLYPSHDYLFLSSGLAPLVAVAGHYIKEVEKTFNGYVYRGAEFADLIDEVDRYSPSYTPTIQTSRLAELLGVKDLDLPSRKGVLTPNTNSEEVV